MGLRNLRSSISIFLVSMLVSGFLLAGITNLSVAQTSSTFTISGYILDSDGHGVSGANIIFNVPDIVPSVYSDSSGYYEIYAPAGTYHVNVWPPFDSNFISYDEGGFSVTSDMTKNITLATGYKVSGYITGSLGAPVSKAVVSLDNFFCGWYSKSSGRYFVTAPAGTYTLRAIPANGPQGVTDFRTYSEYNVVVDGDLEKDITVKTHTEISGYVLDEEGNGLAGARVIFGVPDVVPSVVTDDSGYYKIYAPVGTYHVNVWPPFDSSYLSFAQPEFAVGTLDFSKNITLSSGYKLSGYLTDSSGAPIRGALVALDSFHSGWYSDGMGYYFVTAPTGTYNLTIIPKTGQTFPVYTETNFALTGDTSKNVTLTSSANITFSDNFDDGVADGWTQWSGSWSVIDGEYFISVGIVEDGITTVDGLDFTDCTVETKLRFTDSVGFRSGIIFRFLDSTHYYSIELGSYYDTLDMIKYTPGSPHYGETFAQISADNLFQTNTDYQLKIVVSGNLFRCFIDGEEVLNGTDSSYTHGGVGLRARSADVQFDNFRVENATIYNISDDNTTDPVQPELLAWWKLNEGAGTVVTDSSGNNDAGTINGANWMNYQGTSSLNFNGVSDYVALPSMDLTDLDSLTVVAWINSDLTQVGYIYCHGDNGVFEISNGHYPNGRIPEVDVGLARFGVKLYPSGWIDAFSSLPMKPNTWHQIVGVWVKGVSVKIYVDGVLAGEVDNIPSERLEDAGPAFPSSLGIYSQNRWNIDCFFKGQISNAMTYNKALAPQEITALYENASIPIVARPTLNLSCTSSASYAGFDVEIEGSLTLNETAVADAPILLSYTMNRGDSWQDLTLATTASDGSFSATWKPSVTGAYLIKAVYDGDFDYLGATAEVNCSVAQGEEQTAFLLKSNSTVSCLTFNSTSKTLSFNVAGDAGTTGYADVSIAKTFAQDAAEFEVLLDGNKLNHTISSTADSWLLHFVYSHSTHEVTVNLNNNYSTTTNGNQTDQWTTYGQIIALSGIAAVLLIFTACKLRQKRK